MKKLLIIISLTIVISNFFLNNTFARENIYSSPLLILNHPALLSKQQGLPIGIEILSDYFDFKGVSVSGGLSYLFENNAVAIGYKHIDKDINILSTGFSRSMLISSFGAALKIERNLKTLLPNIDLSYSVDINKSLSYNIIIENIMTLYRSEILYPELSTYIHGTINAINFELGYSGVFFDYSKFKPLNALEISISYEFFKNRNFYTALENSIYKNRENEIITEIGLFIGFNFRAGNFKNGISTGCQHEINRSNGKLVNNILINPLFYQHQKPPMFIISCSCSQNVDNELIINIENVDNVEKIKNWSLIITDYKNDKKLIKSFSGGNIPPKVIVWDLKDSFGIANIKNTLKAQLLVLDINNKHSVSPIILIDPCYKN